MEARILNENFESVAIIDSYQSFIWTDRYNTCGDFEIYMSMDNEALKYMCKDYYLWNPESDHQMIIESLNITSDTEDGNKLIVTGRSLESILDRRIVWTQTVFNNKNLQESIEKLLNDSIIDPSMVERKIDNFVFVKNEDEAITSLTINTQFTGDNLYDIITTLCQANNIGFKITLNESNQFEFSLYIGKDRTYDQSTNPFVIFSPSFENIINSNYLESNSAYKNVTLVAGEGEGNARKKRIVGSGSGLNRRELFTDARDISSEVNGKTLTAKQYNDLLDERGKEKLLENLPVVAFEGEVEATRMFKYGKDFFIGDIVQIANEYGHEGKAYISEFIISANSQGISMYPTFETIQEEEIEYEQDNESGN